MKEILCCQRPLVFGRIVKNFALKSWGERSPDGEMVDTVDSKSAAKRRGGSIPLQGIYK